MKLSQNLEENILHAKQLLPIGQSFDIVTRRLCLGETNAYWIGINGLCKTDLLQRIFSDLQNPLFTQDGQIKDLRAFMNAKIGYAQTSLSDDWEELVRNVLSGPSVLLVDGFQQAVLLDVRTYPARGIGEPDNEKVTRGARDGFVETVLFNTNLIRRRIRSPRLCFEMHAVGTESRTDVAIAYMNGNVNEALLEKLRKVIEGLNVTTLTMGAKSLEELLVKKRWYHPLPSIQITERPDVACSYLAEGHILVLVDNSPSALILPCTVFQFTQSPEDYYKSPVIGSYFRTVRFGCIFLSLLLMPLFLLITAYFPQTAERLHLMSMEGQGPVKLFFYVLAVEFSLDLFKYSAALSSDRYSGALSIVGGLIIGDIAVRLNWASMEVLFYAAITLLSSLALSSIEFSDGIRLYRFFLILATGFGGFWGFLAGIFLVLLSILTTPTFAGMSYFWPLYPYNRQALKTLLFRYPTAKAQPSHVWKRR